MGVARRVGPEFVRCGTVGGNILNRVRRVGGNGDTDFFKVQVIDRKKKSLSNPLP